MNQQLNKTDCVTIILVTYNYISYIEQCLHSIFLSSFKNFKLIIIDNNSTDGTYEYIKKNYPKLYCIRSNINIGYGCANNRGIFMATTEYILITNGDIIIESTCIENLLKIIKKDANIATVGSKLLKIRLDKNKKPIKTNIIDSLGINFNKNHSFTEIGANEEDLGQYDQINEIFGVTGAFFLARKSAFENIKLNVDNNKDSYFDKDYFMYKEDVDLAWRLRLKGYKSVFVSNAIAYHFRAIKFENKKISDFNIIKNRRKKNAFLNYLSYRNHLFTIIKNIHIKNLICYFHYIFLYEFKKIVYIFLFEPKTLKAIYDIITNYKILKKKRKLIFIKNVPSVNIKRWIK
jgi:GT2 family glycosyltransferase